MYQSKKILDIEDFKWKENECYTVVLFYKYAEIDQQCIDDISSNCNEICIRHGIVGRILLSLEGINGTLAGSPKAITAFVDFFNNTYESIFFLIDWKFSFVEASPHLPFTKLSVRQVKEIISVGSNGLDTISNQIKFDKSTYGGLLGTGIHLSPEEFHNAIENSKSRGQPMKPVIVDIRNNYEYEIGHFEGSINLKTFTYSETWASLDKLLDDIKSEENKFQKTPMFLACTGGIRCEKASAYLVAKGMENVYQLQGGIHRYLETYPHGGLFKGKNFVFDGRVAVANTDNSSCNENTTVIGKCVCCASPHDQFTSNIVCTVCRQIVLVCGDCVKINPFIDEFYCCRHDYLKGSYFTVIERFTDSELSDQRRKLLTILENLSTTSDKRKRSTIRKQIKKIEAYMDVKRIESAKGEIQSSPEDLNHEFSNTKTRGGWGFWR